MAQKSLSLKKSLQAQLILWVGLCLWLVGGIIIAYAALVSQASAVESAKQIAIGQAKNEATNVKAQIEVALDSARTSGTAFTAIKAKTQPISLTRDQVNGMLYSILQGNPQFLATYTLWEPDAFDGKDAAYVNQAGHDSTGRFIPYWNRGGAGGAIELAALADYEKPGVGDYYLIPKNTLKESIIEPYIYPINGKDVLMTSLVEPIVVDGKFYGISGVDFTLDFLQKLADGVNIYNKTGRLDLISNTGIIAASTGKPELVGKNVSEVLKDAQDHLKIIQAGEEDVAVKDNALIVYTPIQVGFTTTPWSARIEIPYSVITAQATQNTRQMVLIAVVLTTLGVLAIWFLIGQIAIRPLRVITSRLDLLQMGDLNRNGSQQAINILIQREDEIGIASRGLAKTETYLQEMAATAQSIATGDLTVTVNPRSENDELGQSFTLMVAGLRSMIHQVSENATSLTLSSTQLASAAGQAGQATSQISTTIQQVAQGITQQTESISKTASSAEKMGEAITGVTHGAQEQSRAVARTSDITTQISTAIQQVAAHAKTSVQVSSQAAETARAGARTVQETIQGMQSIKAKVGLSSEKVLEMGQRSDQIGTIVETIDDIASQTNLLALNAAIEAARAGEHGKGFAVVADEVRKLAERSSTATKEIGGLIKGIQKTVSEAVAAMGEGAKEVEKGVVRANQSDEALNSILKAAEAVNQQVEEIARAAQLISGSANDLVSSMDAVSTVVEENTAATRVMSANSGEVTQAVESIASVSEENSAAVEEVSASTEEMSAQVEEVNASAQSLSEMASALQQVVAQFKF
jgi:methyl-accepting chemotaxis protein